MEIPANRRKETITIKIAGEKTRIAVEWITVESNYNTLRVATMDEALKMAYYYRYSHSSEIIKAADSDSYLVTVWKVDH